MFQELLDYNLLLNQFGAESNQIIQIYFMHEAVMKL